MAVEKTNTDADATEEQRFLDACEEFYWRMRRRMTHGLVDARFICESLDMVLPKWRETHSAELVRASWGEKCSHYDKECPSCIAWKIFEENARNGVKDLEPVLSEVLMRMDKEAG